MKKLNYLILGLASLTLASCSQDDILEGVADGNYQVTINLPADVATRAIGDNALAAQQLNYAIFDENGEYVSQGTANFGGNSSMTLPLSLASGASFKIAFFAQSPNSTNVYKFNASQTAHSVTVDYSEMESNYNNLDDYDCFYNVLETGVIGSNTMKTQVTLNRIVAQINWGTSDYNQATVTNTYGTNLADLTSTLSVTVPNEFDLLTGETAGQPDKVEIGVFTPNNGADAETFPVSGYQFVAMQYVLVPADKGLYNLDLAVSNKAGTAENPIKVDNAPIQANYRTNIYGNLLTDNIQFKVDLSAEWGTPDYNLPQDAQSLIAALAEGGNVVLGSDVNLPTFPTITKNTTLDLNGHTLYYDFTLPNKTDDHMIVVNGANLTITGNGRIADNIPYPADNKNTLIYVTGGGSVTIENGDFSASGAGQLIYVQEGTANIQGGSFALTDDYSNDFWCINCQDGTYKETSFVNVTGGQFYKWNPASTNTEGTPNVSYVADGYQSVATTINGATWYVVVPEAAAGETVKVATSTTEVASAIENASGNTTIYVTANTTVKLPSSASNKTITVKGLDPVTTVIDAQNAYWTYEGSNITLENLTVETFVNTTNHTSMGFKNATSQTFNNVTFDGEFHVFSGNADFTDCTFNYVAASGTNYQLWCDTNGTVNVTDCIMNCNDGKAILVYGESANATGGNVNVNGLTVTSIGKTNDKGVVEIHSENYIKAETVRIQNVTYPASYFPNGLWREINNNKNSSNYEKATHYYTIYVNGTEVQAGGQTGAQPAN